MSSADSLPMRSAATAAAQKPHLLFLCLGLQLCKNTSSCYTCGDMMLHHASEALKILGGVGLFFSFTEVSGTRANPAPSLAHSGTGSFERT